MGTFWNRFSRQADSRENRRRSLQPDLESIENRLLLHTGVAIHHAAAAITASASQNPLANYRVFEGSITRGPAKGLVNLDGPLVVGFDGRIQFSGYLFPTGGGVDYVFGTETGGGVAMTIVIPTTHHTTVSVSAFGSGQLQGVKGGLPGGMSLVGSGTLQGPDYKRDSGTWETLAPSKAGGT
jgi:hypothetical protein